MLPSNYFQYYRGWLYRHVMVMFQLVNELQWEQPEIKTFGKTYLTPRLLCPQGKAYSYSGLEREDRPWHPIIADIRDRACLDEFNSCEVNYYRDGSDSIGWHSDDEACLGPDPGIVSVSLGARRKFAVKLTSLKFQSGYQPTDPDEPVRWDVDLGEGDLLVMLPGAQAHTLHSVPKTKTPVGPRINLTFRKVIE